ncbi:MAG: hypothetical protein QOJ04_4375, partial [Caballeronia sp.]|nr:hypothetical protein [Caballeronia sp.]
DGRLLKSSGENIASVIGHLERASPASMQLIQEYLKGVVPSIHGVERLAIDPMESLAFQQDMGGGKRSWQFRAHNMSDGALRALGVLTALFQRNVDYAPSLIGIEEPETALHPAAAAALREALKRASGQSQIVVTSHSPDLLDDFEIAEDAILAVGSMAGQTYIAPLDAPSRDTMREHLFSAGELLRLNQLSPDPIIVENQASKQRQPDLFGEGN